MTAGKSTVGRCAAGLLSRPFVDLDEFVEEAFGTSAAEVFAEHGEAAFRDAESCALADVGRMSASVVATGGGVVLREENRALLRELGTVVYLAVSAKEALVRTVAAARSGSRPLLAADSKPTEVATLLKSREPFYREVADAVIETDGCNVEDIAAEIVRIGGGV